jgi:hypothetical protein
VRLRGNSAIVSRGQDGTEHLLSVADHPAGMVSIADDEVIRLLSPCATLATIAAAWRCRSCA